MRWVEMRDGRDRQCWDREVDDDCLTLVSNLRVASYRQPNKCSGCFTLALGTPLGTLVVLC